MTRMGAIDSAHGFDRAVHVIGRIPAMYVHVDETGRDVTIPGVDNLCAGFSANCGRGAHCLDQTRPTKDRSIAQ